MLSSGPTYAMDKDIVTRLRYAATVSALCALSFAAAFAVKRRHEERLVREMVNARAAEVQANLRLPDSVRLRQMGVPSGRQLVAYVLISSKCAYCSLPATRMAVEAIRDSLSSGNRAEYGATKVVGVVLDTDLDVGVDFLGKAGVRQFDEVSIGGGWLNEMMMSLVWRQEFATAGVPTVILISRTLAGKIEPFSVRPSSDSLIGVINGSQELVAWVRSGARLPALRPLRPADSGTVTSIVSIDSAFSGATTMRTGPAR